MLDQVIYLMTFSDFHRDFTTDQISRCIIPPVNLNQCAGLVENGYLTAWVSWAFMDDKSADKFLEGEYTMEPSSWSSGERLVFMDCIAPFGQARQLMRLCRQLFPDYPKAEWRRHLKQRRVGVMVNV